LPGALEIGASLRRPASRFMSDDFPTFERPETHISGSPSPGRSSPEYTEQ